MNRMLVVLLFALLIHGSVAVVARAASPSAPDIIVEGTKTGTPLEQLTGAVTILDEDTIRNMRVTTVLEVLRQVEGLDVVQSGGPGGLTSFFIRGANSRNTMVLLDGVKVNSPTSGQFDAAHLTVDQIERIEVIRGTQSALYGSDAASGVINIITKRGREDLDSLTVEGGSYRTWRGQLTHAGRGPAWNRTLSLSRWSTQGISRADEDLGNTEPDGYANTTFSVKLDRATGVGGRTDLTLRLTDAVSDLDDFPPPLFELTDFPAKQRTKSAVAGLSIAAPLSARWDHRLLIGWSRDHATTTGAAFGDSDLDGQSRQIDWQHTVGLGPDNLLTVGYEHQSRRANYSPGGEHHVGTSSFYFQDQLARFDPLFISVGGRTDDNNRFGRHNTYKVGASLNLAQGRSRVFGNYGTGFRGPTLDDLFYPGFGNPSLQPEESAGYEVGLRVEALPRFVTIGGTYFRTQYDDLIAADSSGVPNNKDAEVSGVEVFGEAKAQNARIQGTYTYTATRDSDTNDLLVNRPRNKAGVALIFEPEPDARLRVDARYVGERLAFSGTTMPSYLVVNLAASQQMSPNLDVFLRAENLFDRDYEEVTGYGTPGRSLYGGFTARF